MRIGISVHTHANQNIWESGSGQNVFFLAQSLKAVPFVQSVLLINTGDQDRMPASFDLGSLGVDLMRPDQAADAVDVIIELGGALNPHWLALQRARGKKVVSYCTRQPHAHWAEATAFDRKASFLDPDRCDRIWLLPQHSQFAAMMRTVHRCAVDIAPFIWGPDFVRGRMQEVASAGYSYGWTQEQFQGQALKVAIFEPNISVVKTSSIPMLVCEEAFRSEPGCIGVMHVLNSMHLKDHNTMLYLANSLNVVQQSKACFHGRHDVVGFMVQNANAVVSHQWTNDQNYNHLDVLYGGYPLIHNSPWLQGFGAGYYYQGFNAAEGSLKLLGAWRGHAENLSIQKAAAQKVFDAVNPLSTRNVQAHEMLLRNLCQDSPRWMEMTR